MTPSPFVLIHPSMSAVLHNLLPNLQFRRPALRRHSAIVPFHRILDDYIRRIYIHQLEGYLTLIEHIAAKAGPQAKGKFPFDLHEELFKIRPMVLKVFDTVYDYTWEHIVSGHKPRNFIHDERVQAMMRETIMGLPVKAWLEWTIQQLFTHIIHSTENLLPKHIPNANGFTKDIHRLLCKLPEFLAASDTLDECLKKVYDYLSYLPIKEFLHDYIHKSIYSIKDVEPDLYYTQMRQFVILPPSLVSCIREELRCQSILDNAIVRRRKAKQQRTKSRTAKGGTRMSSHSKKSHPLVGVREAVRKARMALNEAEDRTAKLVDWYEASDEVAKKRIAFQRTLVGTHGIVNKTSRRLKRFLGQDTDSMQQKTARRRLKEALGRQARRDPSRALPYNDRRLAKQVSLFQFSLLEIVFALISPFHVYHREWNGRPEFVALTHHLHMLNLLPPLAIHIPVSPTDFRYVRHIRGIPFTDIDTKTNQQMCMREGNAYREAVCDLAMSMNNPLYPRELILKSKHCYDRAMLARVKKNAAKSYRRVEREAARMGNATRRSSQTKS